MGFFDFFRINKKESTVQAQSPPAQTIEVSLNEKFERMYLETYVTYLSFYSNVNRIANAFCKCQFETYSDNKRIQGDEWYLWNVKPNKNQSASTFKNKLITKLYENNEALVIATSNGDLYVAESYNHKKNVMYEDVFENVQVRDITFNRTFRQSEVLFFKLNDANLKKLIDGFSLMMQQLVAVALDSYKKSQSEKVLLDVGQIATADARFSEIYENLVTNDFRSYFSDKDAVLPLFDGYQINDASRKPDFTNTPKGVIDLIHELSDRVSTSMNVPLALENGDSKDISKVIDELLTFCIDPLVNIIQEEILAKRYGLDLIKKGSYLKINSETIKHVDIFDISTSIEKLISSGCFNVNDIRRVIGKQEIDEDWANQYFMTKNFATVDEMMNAMKGGGNDE